MPPSGRSTRNERRRRRGPYVVREWAKTLPVIDARPRIHTGLNNEREKLLSLIAALTKENQQLREHLQKEKSAYEHVKKP